MGYSKSAAGVTGANALISIDTSATSLKSATAGVEGARLVRAILASGATSEKSASIGVAGANPTKSITAMFTSSKVASSGAEGASVITALSLVEEVENVSLPAKRMPALSVKATAKIIVIVAFILLLCLFDEAKIYRMCDV